jgi:ribonuclease P protein component
LDPERLDKSFGRQLRLTANPEFQRVFRHGRRSADRCFTVLFCHNTLARPRLGLAIAKRRVRKATARNRLKRLVRESFRDAAGQLPAVDVVVLAGPAAATADNKKLLASLEQHWRRVAKRAVRQEEPGKH